METYFQVYFLAITSNNCHVNYFSGNRSIVPMIQLTWNLARNIKISEKKLYEHMRCVKRSSLDIPKHHISYGTASLPGNISQLV